MPYETSDGRGKPARLAALAVSTLCLVAACGGSTKPTATPSSPVATPNSSPATAPPTASAAATPTTTPSGSPGTPDGAVSATPAGATDVSQFTRVAGSARSCGFKGSADTLTKAKVTNNGWGIATVTARNPQDQGNAQVIFKQGGSGWSVADCGSDFTGDGIPSDVLTALGA